MRVRRATIAPALVALALTAAGCGGDDEDAAGVATTPAPTTQAVATTPAASDTPRGTSHDRKKGRETPHAVTGVTTKDSISTQISKNPDLRTLYTALGAAGMMGTLDRGQYTLLAPSNDAFLKLGTQLDALLQPSGKQQLVNLLKFHIIKGKVRASALKDGKLYTTLQGDRVRASVKGNTITIGNSLGKATIVTPNAKASNGIIHTIDTVLRPKR